MCWFESSLGHVYDLVSDSFTRFFCVCQNCNAFFRFRPLFSDSKKTHSFTGFEPTQHRYRPVKEIKFYDTQLLCQFCIQTDTHQIAETKNYSFHFFSHQFTFKNVVQFLTNNMAYPGNMSAMYIKEDFKNGITIPIPHSRKTVVTYLEFFQVFRFEYFFCNYTAILCQFV
jgi:hypothetical protein